MNLFDEMGDFMALDFRQSSWLALVLGVLVGCSPEPSAPSKPESSSGAPVRSRAAAVSPGSGGIAFGGLSQLVASEDAVHLAWTPATDDRDAAAVLRYRVYLASESGDQDFSRPHLETSPGASRVTVPSLPSGTPVYVVVRAVDTEGNEDDNEVEGVGCPNPVRYVDPDTPAKEPDGRSPATAYATIQEAVESAIATDGVNVHIRGGRYRGRFFVFDGMMLFGGFDATFDAGTRDVRATVLESPNGDNLVTIAPGTRVCGLDGLRLSGGQVTGRGILGEGCRLSVSNCEIRGFTRNGICLRGGESEDSRVEGCIQRSTVAQNLGEGIALSGNLDVAIRDCVVAENGAEGIEAGDLTLAPGEKTRLEVERCVVRDNPEIGIEIDLDAPEDVEEGHRYRIAVRDCVVSNNRDHGVHVDVLYAESAPIDLKVKIDGNTVVQNAKAGVHVDADAPGDYRLGDNELRANGDSGMLLTGSSPRSLFRVHHDRILENGSGVVLRGPGQAVIRNCLFLGNRGAAVEGTGWIDVGGCLLFDNGGDPLSVPRISHSLQDGDTAWRPGGPEDILIDAGDPLERDADGTRADLGPGRRDGLRSGSSRWVELASIDPPPGTDLDELAWTLRFTHRIRGDVRLGVRIDDRDLEGLELAVDGAVVQVTGPGRPAPGTTVSLILFPGDLDALRRQPWHMIFEYPIPGGSE